MTQPVLDIDSDLLMAIRIDRNERSQRDRALTQADARVAMRQAKLTAELRKLEGHAVTISCTTSKKKVFSQTAGAHSWEPFSDKLTGAQVVVLTTSAGAHEKDCCDLKIRTLELKEYAVCISNVTLLHDTGIVVEQQAVSA